MGRLGLSEELANVAPLTEPLRKFEAPQYEEIR